MALWTVLSNGTEHLILGAGLPVTVLPVVPGGYPYLSVNGDFVEADATAGAVTVVVLTPTRHCVTVILRGDMRDDMRHVIRNVAAAIASVILLSYLVGCCSTHHRFDGARYYRVDKCPWGERVVCDSATRLPDPATWTTGCR